MVAIERRHGESIDQMVRRFKKASMDVLADARRSRQTPSERRRRKRQLAERRRITAQRRAERLVVS